ncbi:MAG: carbohydrate-binding domain-containing protein [Porcipelethomonas sp.]
MKTLKKMLAVVTALFMGLSVYGCSDNSSNDVTSTEDISSSKQSTNSDSKTESAEALSNINSEYFDDDDLNVSAENAAEIYLKGTTAESDSKKVSISGGIIELSQGGTYHVSGTLSDGQIYVNTKELVHLILDNAEITNNNSAAIYIENSDKTVITAAENSVNTLSDGVEYDYENEENEPDAVIFSADDLSINGTGTLNINGNYNEGITTKNDLNIADTKINVKSVGNGIKGKDELIVRDAEINIDSDADGMKSSNSAETDKGYIIIESGIFNITAADDAFQAETSVLIENGEFNILTANGSSGSYSSSGSENSFFGGKNSMEGNSNKSEISAKGIKAGTNIIINNGTINANCGDDTLHSNESIEINGGSLNLSSADDGIHANENIDINGGEITISESYEGIEATVININKGIVRINSSDDGFNASEGSSSDEQIDSDFSHDLRGGFGDVSENCQLNINDGYVYVNADGDGLDSNGTINISGGTILVNGPVNDGNGALDPGTEIIVTGGILVAAGSSGMAETPSDSSSQYSVSVAFSETQQGGTPVSITDENGNSILTFTPSKSYSSVVISTPDLSAGKKYSVYYGGSCSGNSEDGYYGNTALSGGYLLDTIEISEAVTSAGDGAVGQMGGRGNFGGRRENNGEFNGEMPMNGAPPEMPEDRFGGNDSDFKVF